MAARFMGHSDASVHRFRALMRNAYDIAMAVGAAYLQYVLEQLARTERLTSRRMFGGVGLYSDGLFFGLIHDDTLFLKVDDTARGDYESRGMKPFAPFADRPEVSMAYFTVPADVLDDAEELVAWARRSIAIAAAAPKARPKTPAARGKRAAQAKRPATPRRR